tara:strand:- start:39 stop:938 length:900 start_codon:yes stop_codon:yes gene_type:complete
MAPKDYSYTEVEDPSIVREEELMPSSIEDIDKAMYDYVNDTMKIFCTTNKGWERTPVVWVSPERAMHSKRDKELQGNQDSFVWPAITVERTGFTKDINRKGGVFGPFSANAGQTITIARKINQEKTQKFANAGSLRLNKQSNFPTIGKATDQWGNTQGLKNNKVVYQTVSMPMPIYVDVTYSITLFSEYQQQMNEMMSSFANLGGSINYFTIHRNRHTYEAFIQQDFSSENNVSQLAEEERKYKTKVDIKVLGYLIGDGNNDERPKMVYRENTVDVKIGRERVIVGDIPDFKTKTTYRD